MRASLALVAPSPLFRACRACRDTPTHRTRPRGSRAGWRACCAAHVPGRGRPWPSSAWSRRQEALRASYDTERL